MTNFWLFISFLVLAFVFWPSENKEEEVEEKSDEREKDLLDYIE